jgi:hypothetical protein
MRKKESWCSGIPEPARVAFPGLLTTITKILSLFSGIVLFKAGAIIPML